MTIEFSKTAQRYLRKTQIRDPETYRKIKKTLNLLRINPNYPSLRLHKLSNSQKDYWSLSIDRSLRIIFRFKSDKKVLVAKIGTHNEVYRN